ncbi:hypothetical protein LSAT2_024294 [Lamellibrachia satsuma]|nr:hypothetical protein LSAT2_024294 [Lamellibrachia satsuma]
MTKALLVWPRHSTQHHCKNHPARYPGGQEKAPWRAREGTLEGERRHPGGQENTPWRAREDTLEDETTGPPEKNWLDNIQEWTHRDLATLTQQRTDNGSEDYWEFVRIAVKWTPGPVAVLNLDYIETSWSTTSTTLLPQRCSSVLLQQPRKSLPPVTGNFDAAVSVCRHVKIAQSRSVVVAVTSRANIASDTSSRRFLRLRCGCASQSSSEPYHDALVLRKPSHQNVRETNTGGICQENKRLNPQYQI